jgi:nitrous oxidase accessory protein
MKKLLIYGFGVLLTISANAGVWRVSAGGSIRQAIANAAPGDTILVGKGIYKEKNIVVDKPLCLTGIDLPVLDGEGKYEIITIKADAVTVQGFYLQHSGYSSLNDLAGIRLMGVQRARILHNYLDDTYFGIYSQQARNCRIEGNILRSNAVAELQSGNGIHCWKCDSMRIIRNTIYRHRDGIYFEFVTNSEIRQNNSYNNLRYGLHFMFSHNDVYRSNVFWYNGAGVAVMYSHGVQMLNNVFAQNWGDAAYGLLLKDITDSRAVHNHFVQNTVGIYMEGSSRITMERNNFNGNGWAMKLQASCTDNTIERCNFESNTFDVSTNGSLVLNRFHHNYWDKYEGYDLNRDGRGDVPYRPVSLYSMVAERNPATMMLFRSFMVTLIDKAEKVIPSITPEQLKDDAPMMRKVDG